MDQITTDQIGAGDSTTFGADVAPSGQTIDMFAYDGIAGQFPPQERNAPPANFTGGMGGGGIGGHAEGLTPGGVGTDGTLYERRGF